MSDSGDKGEDLRSHELQEQKIRQSAELEGTQVEFFPPDIDVSGAKPKRETLDAIIERIRREELGGIYVAKLDRLSRMTPKDRIALFDDVESVGGIILSASEQIDPSTPEGRFAREVFLNVARMQWEKFREGWGIVQANQIAAGYSVVRAPIGYLKKGKRCHLEIDPKTGPHIRKLFELRAGGFSWHQLVEYMDSRNVLTQDGNSFSSRSIAAIIRNRVYLGELHHGKNSNLNAHEPLVDLITWTAAQNPNGNRLAPIRRHKPFLLVGLLRCEFCRYAMATSVKEGGRYYRCAQKGCPNQWKLYNAKKVERAFTRTEIPVLSPETFWADGRTTEKVDTTHLQEAYALAKSLEAQASSTEAQLAFGAEWLSVVAARKQAAKEALDKLVEAQKQNQVEEEVDPEWTTEEFRAALGRCIDCISISRENGMVVYAKGKAPEVPIRGKIPTNKVLQPFPKAPKGAKRIQLV